MSDEALGTENLLVVQAVVPSKLAYVLLASSLPHDLLTCALFDIVLTLAVVEIASPFAFVSQVVQYRVVVATTFNQLSLPFGQCLFGLLFVIEWIKFFL